MVIFKHVILKRLEDTYFDLYVIEFFVFLSLIFHFEKTSLVSWKVKVLYQ